MKILIYYDYFSKLIAMDIKYKLKINTDIVYVVAPSPITLDRYFDVNAHLGYKYNERWTAFLRANNITNKSYQKWLDYQVQGCQVVLGANYKFDF